MAGKLKIVVLYDRWEPDDDSSGTNGKAPLVRTLDKKEVEEEVRSTRSPSWATSRRCTSSTDL